MPTRHPLAVTNPRRNSSRCAYTEYSSRRSAVCRSNASLHTIPHARCAVTSPVTVTNHSSPPNPSETACPDRKRISCTQPPTVSPNASNGTCNSCGSKDTALIYPSTFRFTCLSYSYAIPCPVRTKMQKSNGLAFRRARCLVRGVF